MSDKDMQVGKIEQLTTVPGKLKVKGKHRLLPDCIGQHELQAIDLKEEIQRLQADNDKLMLRLSELCQLKAIKDNCGKTAEYELRQPTAWQDAFRLLEQLQEKDGE